MNPEAQRIHERIAQAERDLAEVAEQAETGEIDQQTADALSARYQAEYDALVEGIESDDTDAGDRPLSGRTILTIGVPMILVIAALLFVVANNSTNTAGVEGLAEDVISGDAPSLESVTNEEMEAVIAQNPDIPAMRLALGDRYFFEGDFSNALRHYMYVLEDLGVADPEALANVGWMTYQSGFPDVAVSFVERSLDVQPSGGLAFWYLANIQFNGLDDPDAAVDPLEKLLAIDNLPDALRSDAEALLAEVRAAL